MQGNLNEIDIRSILQLIELGQRTGLLFVEDYGYPNCPEYDWKKRSWYVFFLNGQIIYAANGDSSLSRLGDYLRHYQIKVQLDEMELASIASLNAPEYGYLWTLLSQNTITPKQARSIIHGVVHETLFDLLSLHKGSFIFELGSPLAPQLTTLEIAPILTRIIKQVQEWKQLYPYIQSPDQFPVLADLAQLRSSLPVATVNKLQNWANGKTSLRQLARYLNRNTLTVGRAIYPYIQQGWMQLVYSVSSESTDKHWGLNSAGQKARIVCIDDAMTVCEVVKTILQPQGFDAIAFTNPLEALSLVFQLQPDLILCDIAMPQLDGYEICAMLRHSTAFRLLPIIMLTGLDGFIDQVKAKMVGATDYLTKPFGDTELLMLVEKYLQPSNS
ncbi:response regulator [Iningainema tapete]|uniref:Protein PatA n=1 Tax=Iningainema tapete BLCC-T55 TaxID=2748662 RepID=A0A8J6XP19_9CYAN|nr:response regulator [Iningainema tapete]MBD2771043.1 DUF4388 domain-containing protein [Iningainema tapete BLCC-T55]